MKKIADYVKPAWHTVNNKLAWVDTPTTWTRVYILFTLLALVFILPILLAGVYFQDDFYRMHSGASIWASFGRFGADIIARLLMFSGPGKLVDPGQLFQFASIPLLALSALLAMKAFTKVPTFRASIPFMFIILNPFILTNISYRYDSFGMVAAYLLAILAFYLLTVAYRRPFVISLIFPIIAIFLSTSIYQSMPSLFLGLSLVYAGFLLLDQKLNIQTIIKKWASYLVVYVAGVASATIVMGLVRQQSEARNSFTVNPTQLISNLGEYIALIKSFLTNEVLLLILPIILVGGTFMVVHLISRNIWLRIPLILTVCIALIMATLGPLLLMVHPTILPRSTSAFVLVIVVSVGVYVLGTRKLRPAATLLVAPLAIYLIGYSWVYGNFISLYDEHRERVVASITADLNTLNNDQKPVHINGRLEAPYNLLYTAQQYPLIRYTYGTPPQSAAPSLIHTYFGVVIPLRMQKQPGVETASTSQHRAEHNNYRETFCSNNWHEPIERAGYKIYEDSDQILISLSEEYSCP